MILIIYTTRYRKGGDKFIRVAGTLSDELVAQGKQEVVHRPVENKLEFRKLMFDIKASGKSIEELHFIGHSGMYGPMFGSISFPEQFSPWEWEQLAIPFAKDARAFFRCCRSARWFASFFAKTFRVNAYGYFWYTSFSSHPLYFRPYFFSGSKGKLFCFGCHGRKSHGIIGSLKKYSGFLKAEKLKEFQPVQKVDDTSYGPVSKLYDKVFSDIKVREDEWRWIQDHLPQDTNIRILDIGCGNGSLLKELSSLIAKGDGVDESPDMIVKARDHCSRLKNISFTQIEGPLLPYADASFDLAVSLLSFRYLDWDPVMNEISRVLRPEGKLLLIDMVTVPVKHSEYFRLIRDKLKLYRQRKRFPEYHKALKELVTHPSWSEMLKYNPIRAQHEYKWYLESRFPGRRTEIINIGYRSRILAFDSGPMKEYKEMKLTYP